MPRRWPSWKQLGHLPRFLSPAESWSVKLLLALAAIAALAAGGKYASGHLESVPAIGGDYAEAAVGSPQAVNPILTNGNDMDADLVKLVFTGLMKTDAQGELVPDLAESFTLSPDGKVYEFRLRDDVTWHDGAPFIANDVKMTVEAIKTPAWKSPLLGQFRNIAVETPDDRTVRFTLPEPFAPFLSMLTLGLLPSHLWQEIEPENAARAELNLKPVGTGPFKFKNFIKDKKGTIRSYSLGRFDRYYGGSPLLETITFKFYLDFAAAAEAISSRRADGISFLPLDLRSEVEKSRSLHIYNLRLPQYTAVFLNPKKNAALVDKAVRQALATALDRERLITEAVAGAATTVEAPIPPGFVGYHPAVRRYAPDLVAAGALLDQAGWKLDPSDNIRARESRDEKAKTVTKTPLAITLTTADSKENIAVAEFIRDAWQSLGVKTELQIVPASRIQKENIKTKDYDALLYGELIGPDPDPYPFWHSKQIEEGRLNLAMFANRRADELLEKARRSSGTEERAGFYREFQDILAEEEPAIFLYSPTYPYAVSRKIRGIGVQTIFTPADRFTDAAKWYMDTRRVWR